MLFAKFPSRFSNPSSRAGRSRSATIVIAYLAWSKQISYKESYSFVKSKREIIKPNSSFFAQLALFEKALRLPLNHWKASKMDDIEQIDLRISLLPEHYRYRVDHLAVERNGMVLWITIGV